MQHNNTAATLRDVWFKVANRYFRAANEQEELRARGMDDAGSVLLSSPSSSSSAASSSSSSLSSPSRQQSGLSKKPPSAVNSGDADASVSKCNERRMTRSKSIAKLKRRGKSFIDRVSKPLPKVDTLPISSKAQRAIARKRSRRYAWKLALFTIFLIYPSYVAQCHVTPFCVAPELEIMRYEANCSACPNIIIVALYHCKKHYSISRNVFAMFACDEIDGVHYVHSDLSLICGWGDKRWSSFVVYTTAMILVFPIGIPVIFFVMLYRHRARLSSAGVRNKLGFLYEGYEYDMWWFELLDMLNKLVISSMLVFVDPLWQMPLGMLCCCSYTLVLLLCQPYIRKSDDRLALTAQMFIFLILLAGYVTITRVELDGRAEVDYGVEMLMSACLISLAVGLMVLGTYMSVMTVRKLYYGVSRRDRLRGAGSFLQVGGVITFLSLGVINMCLCCQTTIRSLFYFFFFT
jgi:hypothetical protein